MKTMKFAVALAAMSAISFASAATYMTAQFSIPGIGFPSSKGNYLDNKIDIQIEEASLKALMAKNGHVSAPAAPAAPAIGAAKAAAPAPAKEAPGQGTGKVSYSDLSVMKVMDKASPILAKYCAAGTHFKKVILTCRKAGKEQQEYYVVTLSDAFITNYKAGTPGGDKPTDSFSLNFSKFHIEYDKEKKGA